MSKKLVITENTRVGMEFNPNQKFYFTKKLAFLVRPHGDNCGCKKTKQYGIGLGCPNPSNKLKIC